MPSTKLTLSGKLILAACLIFDAAVIVAFTTMFGWFALLEPEKSIAMLLVLLLGLFLGNAALVFPNSLLKAMGIAYSTSIVFLILLYAVVANAVSAWLIAGSLVWYVVWELFVLALFISLLAIAGFFSKGVKSQLNEVQMEQMAAGILRNQLLEIEGKLLAKPHELGKSKILDAFIKLKERVEASTPFMRVTGNGTVSEIEHTIGQKIEALRSMIGTDSTEQSTEADTLSLIEEIRGLVMRREQLIIK